ncbi:MAG: site-specific DNA-methyltransferase [Alphaproteobacteria bacterium]|nr:site-specific DNA-methyltransferase [Alphaproteobacteria bacterium]
MIEKKTTRNKTISLRLQEEVALSRRAVKFAPFREIPDLENQIVWQDTFYALRYIPNNFADLMVVDPPYNLTKNFGKNVFKQTDLQTYKKWLDKWLSKTVRILKPNASIYICSDWQSSLVIPEVASKYFILRNRISWEREKGRAAANNWKNCLEDIWYFTKSDNFTFNLDAVKVQRKVLAPYRDVSGNPKDWQETAGQKVRYTAPSNIWTDITVPFWSMPENTEHPTQKPEKLIAKLILASSNAGDMVFDPFVGSGTTAVVAKKLGRHFLGIERERKYVALALKRLDLATDNPTIQGYENGVFKNRNAENFAELIL